MQNWVWANCAPAAILSALRLFGFQPAGGSIGMSAAPMKKSALPVTLRPDGNSPRSRIADRGLDQRARIEIEHRLGVGLVARARIVAAQHQQIADAERRRAEQIALQREPVAVAAGELQHRLDAALATGSRPPRARPDGRARRPPSVTLTASARPFSGSALASRSSRSHETGGVTSAVMTKRPEASAPLALALRPFPFLRMDDFPHAKPNAPITPRAELHASEVNAGCPRWANPPQTL